MDRRSPVPDPDFRWLLREAPVLLLVLRPDPQLTVAEATDAWLRAARTGREAVLGRPFADVLSESDARAVADGPEHLLASLERVRASGQPERLDVPAPGAEGESGEGGAGRWRVTHQPVLDAAGGLRWLLHLAEPCAGPRAEDAGGGPRALQELKAANEELESFACVVSHDLKAPLRAIGALADWISADQADRFDEEGREQMRLLRSRVRRMDRLIDGILQYSRLGRLKEERVPLELDALVAEVVDLLAPPPHIRVEVDPLPTVHGDRARLQQVFQNLIGNAIRHMDKPEGRVHVGCEAADGFWRFRVRDNGPGIEPRHRERIFGLFQTLQPRDRSEDSGIGLALVQRIVEMHGGRVGVESVPGQGSTFHFTWPKSPAGPRA